MTTYGQIWSLQHQISVIYKYSRAINLDGIMGDATGDVAKIDIILD